MSDWLMRVIKAEAARLIEMAAEDDELRADLRALAQAILASTADRQAEDADAASAAPSGPAPACIAADAPTDAAAAPEAAESDANQPAEPMRRLTLGRPAVPKNDPGSLATVAPTSRSVRPDLMEIESRCRWKSEGARWAAERLRRIREGNNIQINDPLPDEEMAEWAERMTDCYYWTRATESSEEANLGLLDDLGGCFETVAEALELVRDVQEKRSGGPRVLERLLPLVSEAQSALRAALARLDAPDDPDQLEVFEWLKATAARHHLYIKRFMRADDLADPSRWSDLLARIESLPSGTRWSREQGSRIEQLKDRVQRIQAGEGTDEDWPAIIRGVDDLVAEKVAPSNREIRELLLSVLDDIPEAHDLPAGCRLVLREIDRFLATRRTEARAPVAIESSAVVKEVAPLLRGQCVALIGGSRRRAAQEALKKALGLVELIWVETKEHQAVDTFIPMIARADVALVLLAIRWSSHAFGDVRQFCDRFGKPLVRLPGGYSVNQVAAQILAQCSGQLADRARETARE
jgi:hypothetical protein